MCDKTGRPYRTSSMRQRMKRKRSLRKAVGGLQQVEDSSLQQNIGSELTSAQSILPPSEDLLTQQENISRNSDCDLFETEHVSTSVQNKKIDQICGRRIFDVQHFFKCIGEANDHSPFDCNISHMDLVSESSKGLISTFKMKCRMCLIERVVTTEMECSDTLNVNSSTVLGTLSIGTGFTQTNQFLSILNIPQLSRGQFDKNFDKVSDAILATSWATMEEAGIEEARLAREIGDVDKDGYPLITVIADGAWSKRSYKTKYDASSGVACIVGARTGKILYVAVRNKYCPMCERARAKNITVGEHRCFKNWSGTSTAMESDIILEGFKRSVSLHGLKFIKLVGDGDSSVYQKLCKEKPYGNGIVIEKVECKNHLLRNFCTKLRDLTTKNVSSSIKTVSPRLRSLLKSNIQRLRKGISTAVTYRRKEEKSITEQVNALKNDITNSPKHVFGDHSDCDRYFCTGPKNNEINEVPSLKECGLFDDIIACCNRLTHNAHSLLLNMSNNAAEAYNAVVAKFVGGKRVNFAMKSSYEVRCHAACISYNEKEEYHRVLHKKMTQRSPGKHSKLFMAKLQKRRQYRQSRTQLFTVRAKRRIAGGEADKDYGLMEDILPIEELEEKKNSLMKYLNRSQEDLVSLERNTVGQSTNTMWKKERGLRLTASNFGCVCKKRQTTDSKKVAQRLICSNFSGSLATNWGQDHEQIAADQFSKEFGLKVVSCGLFVSSEYPYLGASPDGIVGEDAIIEIKCPFKMAKLKLHPKEATQKKLVPYLLLQGNEVKLKRTHDYFYQIQGQLALTGRTTCYFVVWTPLGMTCEQIERDDNFWNTMKPKLIDFYISYMLPLLALKEM